MPRKERQGHKPNDNTSGNQPVNPNQSLVPQQETRITSNEALTGAKHVLQDLYEVASLREVEEEIRTISPTIAGHPLAEIATAFETVARSYDPQPTISPGDSSLRREREIPDSGLTASFELEISLARIAPTTSLPSNLPKHNTLRVKYAGPYGFPTFLSCSVSITQPYEIGPSPFFLGFMDDRFKANGGDHLFFSADRFRENALYLAIGLRWAARVLVGFNDDWTNGQTPLPERYDYPFRRPGVDPRPALPSETRKLEPGI